jgi:hypothetical protein
VVELSRDVKRKKVPVNREALAGQKLGERRRHEKKDQTRVLEKSPDDSTEQLITG